MSDRLREAIEVKLAQWERVDSEGTTPKNRLTYALATLRGIRATLEAHKLPQQKRLEG